MTVTVDYEEIDPAGDGATFAANVRTEIQHAQNDLNARPEKATAETITQPWLFNSAVRITGGTVPSGPTAAGTAGTLVFDSAGAYYCVASGDWMFFPKFDKPWP